jgi:hypothetical protein
MPANVEGMVREGLNAYRGGKKEEARALLLRAVEIDQYNEEAWLWLSATVDTPEEQRTCLENVLTINPNNERAKQGLDMLSKKGGAAPPSAGPTPSDEDVLASTMISSSGDEIPSSIEWGGDALPAAPVTTTSSSSSYHHVSEPSAQEYDSWVANLGLGTNSSESDPSLTPAPSPSFSTAFVDDEDLFGLEGAALFGGESETPPAPSIATPPPTGKPSADKVMSPAPKQTAAAKPSSSALLDEIDENEDLIADLDEDYDQAQLDKLDPQEMFRYIPKEIKATRLPGTRERYPIPVMIGLILAVLLNIGAIMFLISQLSSAGG